MSWPSCAGSSTAVAPKPPTEHLRSSAMADPLERLTNLLALLLETREPLTLERIAHELTDQYPNGEAALRGAFERDKTVLRELGITIEQEVLGGDQAGRTAYRIDRRRYELADLDLTDDERRALQLAVAAAHSDDSWGQDGLWKLGVGSEQPSLAVAARVPTFDVLPPLQEAITSRATADFSYRDVVRVVNPYGLLLRDGRWYLIGHEHAHNEQRTYRVDRIEGSVAVGEAGSFERPTGFDIREAFPADPRLMGDPDTEISVAQVRIDASRGWHAAGELGLTGFGTPNPDGSMTVEVPCLNRFAFHTWLLGFGEHAVVEGPAEIRDETIQWLNEIVAAANAGDR